METKEVLNANEIRFRCSSLGKIMTDPKTGTGLSETCKTYLTELFVEKRFGRYKDIENKFMTKGLLVEEDSLTCYSIYSGEVFIKNEERLKNDFIVGTPDLRMKPNRKKVTDIKSSWDIFTFWNTSPDKINKQYYWQVLGYEALDGAPEGSLAYCLINTPSALIADEQRRLMWKMNVIDADNNPEYIEACKQLERRMTYDDIPNELRVREVTIPRNEKDIERIYRRVIECREYMNAKLFCV